MSLRDTLRHAFALNDGQSFTNADRNLIDKLVNFVVDRRMGEAAIMLLESMRPVNFLSSQALHALQPFATMVFNAEEYTRFARLLENRGSIAMILAALEARMSAGAPVKNNEESP